MLNCILLNRKIGVMAWSRNCIFPDLILLFLVYDRYVLQIMQFISEKVTILLWEKVSNNLLWMQIKRFSINEGNLKVFHRLFNSVAALMQGWGLVMLVQDFLLRVVNSDLFQPWIRQLLQGKLGSCSLIAGKVRGCPEKSWDWKFIRFYMLSFGSN